MVNQLSPEAMDDQAFACALVDAGEAMDARVGAELAVLVRRRPFASAYWTLTTAREAGRLRLIKGGCITGAHARIMRAL